MLLNAFLFVGIGGPEILLILFFMGIPAILWLWALVDLLKSDFKNQTNKLVWTLVIIFLPVLGALLYLLIGRGQKVAAVIP
ncbi:PLDc_N domain-containing protein [Pontibacter qinzhouensis]|uniref:PLDc_N domain-containing protein n=1 Tax=Pontibacter qinzhouensis TaxID=2603253 RepID=A0A5C8J8V4_9BACT|nr:PLD nuclease N-terminal domain-containing protein [Pontibacter qinzhouensis]TXK33872.1 PLDc_N domain-containing protein [Pontibacter qinzhouensis]